MNLLACAVLGSEDGDSKTRRLAAAFCCCGIAPDVDAEEKEAGGDGSKDLGALRRVKPASFITAQGRVSIGERTGSSLSRPRRSAVRNVVASHQREGGYTDWTAHEEEAKE